MMNAFQSRGYTLITGEEFYGGTAIVRKYKKGRDYFAIKEIRDDSDFPMEKIDSEINLMLKLKHPNIVTLNDWFISQTEMHVYKCLVMDWCEDNMQHYVDANPKGLSHDEIHFFAADMFKALEYLIIEKNILHRDLKLQNFLLKNSKESPFPIVKLCDFGSAVAITPGIQGTFSSLLFSAPEVSEDEYTSEADVWSLGCCLYWMATGHSIYPKDDVEEFNTLLKEQQAIDFAVIHCDKLKNLLGRMLQFSSKERMKWEDVFKHKFIEECYSETTDVPGKKDNYQSLDELGKGSFGAVTKAWDKQNQRYVAVKKIFRNDMNPNVLRQMAMKEIRIMKLFHHPNICSFFDYFVDDCCFLVMEFCDAGDIQQLIDVRRRQGINPLLSDDEVFSFTNDILCGIKYLHLEKHFAHRDIKPSNMLLAHSLISRNPVVKISDLGLTKRDNYIDPLKTSAGTPAYMAPEIQLHHGNYTFESDLWSIGCVVYYMVTGSLIFPKNNFRLFFSEKRLPQFSMVKTKKCVVDLMRHLIVYQVEERWGWKEIDESPFMCEFRGENVKLIQRIEDDTKIHDDITKDALNTIEIVKKMRANVKQVSVEEMMGVLYLVGKICKVGVEETECDFSQLVNPTLVLFECTRDITFEALNMMETRGNDKDWKVLLNFSRSMFRVLSKVMPQDEHKFVEKSLLFIY
ncbi:hypothetical protein EIN_175500 [Entamoeba invadens IP1]|uniref:hypothetical protein n=1 Tax=Entamoeba invadens IP1 TaxID=370355 RepID=UPI0002C3E31E|nr:hypothetical protein EIN_175500 [Entamoeba invadens IP1]ELP93763.1 hypothetical protein EIN_175500 [Entamoeba invadens IP1]|eukprot:XP_004260534.1 hypothetical protein EIN_175500 [Entamoeba invadens IP1]